MKKRLFLLLLAALLLLVPHVASANSPVRNPWLILVACENVPEGARIDAVLLKDDGSARTLEDLYRSNQIPGVVFEYEDGETAFYLVMTAPDGTETRTDERKLVEYGSYSYDGAANALESKGTYDDRSDNCMTGVLVVGYLVLLLVVPLGLTLLLEFLVSLCFKIRPRRYVLIINLITNPVMNLLLIVMFFIFSQERAVYWIALGVMELLAVVLEFLFYRKKCREIGSGRLFAFSLTANIVSFLLGCSVLYLLT